MKKKFIISIIISSLCAAAQCAQAQYWGPSPALSALGQQQVLQAAQPLTVEYALKQAAKKRSGRVLQNFVHFGIERAYYHLNPYNQTDKFIYYYSKNKDIHTWEQWMEIDIKGSEISSLIQNNPLLHNYRWELLIRKDWETLHWTFEDLLIMTNEELDLLKGFLAGTQKATEAKQSDWFIYILLKNAKTAPIWVVIDTQDMYIYIIYKDKAPLYLLPASGKPSPDTATPLTP